MSFNGTENPNFLTHIFLKHKLYPFIQSVFSVWKETIDYDLAAVEMRTL